MYNNFFAEKEKNIQRMRTDNGLLQNSIEWVAETFKYNYTHNFTWLGRPIMQFPQDLIAMQEIIWQVKPDLIVETGIAYGGSLIFYASLLEMIGEGGQVLGIDIGVNEDNRREIEKHPMYKRITMIEGSCLDESVCKQVYDLAKDKQRVMVCLDSMHTHEHVLKELELYSPLVTKGSYLVVFYTIINDMPEHLFSGRSWNKNNNPKTAVWEFLKNTDRFEIDKDVETKLLITVAPDGYLKCIKD